MYEVAKLKGNASHPEAQWYHRLIFAVGPGLGSIHILSPDRDRRAS